MHSTPFRSCSTLRRPVLTLLTAVSLATSSLLSAQPLVLGEEARQQLTLTLYNQNFGLIQDQRTLPALPAGQRVQITHVSPQMLTETLRIEGAGQIREQSLIPAQLNYGTLLAAHVGQTLELVRFNPVSGQESRHEVELISVDGGQALVRRDGRIEPIPLHDHHWRLTFPALPEHLSATPSLSFVSAGQAAGSARFSYLSQQLGWSMDYVLTLSRDGKQLNVEGMASLYNRSGIAFPAARLRLMAGEVNAPQAAPEMLMRSMAVMDSVGMGSAPAQVQDYYLYSLPEPVSLAADERKQVPLVSAAAIPAQISYEHEFHIPAALDAQRHQAQPRIQLNFTAPALQDRRSPLPAGNVRVFRPDAADELQFIGAASLGNLAAGEEARLPLGQAFDVNISRRQVSFADSFDQVETGQEITITNASSEARTVTLTARFNQPWELKHSSHLVTEEGSSSLSWQMHLPAGGSETARINVALKKRINR